MFHTQIALRGATFGVFDPPACAKIGIFRTNPCPELQTQYEKTGPTRHALQLPSQHRQSSFWTLTQPICPSTSLKLVQTDPKWPPSDRAIWRTNGRARPKPRAVRRAKRRQSARHVCACVRRLSGWPGRVTPSCVPLGDRIATPRATAPPLAAAAASRRRRKPHGCRRCRRCRRSCRAVRNGACGSPTTNCNL